MLVNKLIASEDKHNKNITIKRCFLKNFKKCTYNTTLILFLN